ncbi:hypothetical protein [Streptomyces lunalinharesii]|uniref:Transposase n=1 Tax=Streptomyces lunalinharesii TaxID=333384 RepID=A0ABN3SCH9_9ACTN
MGNRRRRELLGRLVAAAGTVRTFVAELRKAEKEWELEREILRRAAQYFAKEMRT